ncbi:hypothetical protein [Streptomyces sp. CB01881]|uniref:hypothetical protein n=1 Tax=Streptomyces sp. CB01881 TaxID=2078691 RepID=UPI000CDC2DEA|nr:hypothetical protein [Streptomyces sp. CB01881]AUY47714.1 hypothetical protein C2142_00610 [Streptomyces sp. CB01881]TYC76188.1 hypothetical protein EH183_00610 [Streptomyces sp. CB01881]
MNTRISDAKPPARPRPRPRPSGAVTRALTKGLFLLAGLATTVLGFSWFVDANDAVGAYRTAPVCGTAAHTPGTDCVRRETGKVTARKTGTGGESTTYTLTVARETAPGHSYTVDSEFYYDATIGVDVELAVFRGQVAEVSYHGHRAQNPGTPWLTSLEVALLVGLGSALTATGVSWSRLGLKPAPFYFSIAVFVAVMAFLGCLVFVTSQEPLAATLAVPVLGWLLMTACATVATWDG